MNPRMLLGRIAGAFWTLPTLGALLAVGLSVVTVNLDRSFGGDTGLLFAGDPDSARAMLSTVGSSVLTFAALTFSITVVALQLASSQFSPRVLSSLLRDRNTQVSLAVFVGSFVYALLVLRQVRGGTGEFVPGVAVGTSLVLGLASVATLVAFIHHMAQSLRVVTIIERIHGQTRTAIDAWYPEDDGDGSAGGTGRVVAGDGVAIGAPGDGVLAWFARGALVERACGLDVTVEVLVPPGTWVCEGQPVLLVHGGAEESADLAAFIGLDVEREVKRDPAYGFRQLVDIAERALSPGVNDPTTAVQCVDRMHALLRRLACRDLDVGDTVVDGTVRLRVPVPSWGDYLALACDEVRHWGADSLRVHRRLRALLLDLHGLLQVVGPTDDDRVEEVRRQLELLRDRRGDVPAAELEQLARAGDPAERGLDVSAGSR